MNPQDHVARLQTLSNELQAAWAGFAKTTLHIMPLPDKMETDLCGQPGFNLVPGVSVEDLIVYPVVFPHGVLPRYMWGWCLQRLRLVPGSPICEDDYEYEFIGNYDGNDAVIASIVAELATMYAMNTLRSHRQGDTTETGSEPQPGGKT